MERLKGFFHFRSYSTRQREPTPAAWKRRVQVRDRKITRCKSVKSCGWQKLLMPRGYGNQSVQEGVRFVRG